MSKFREIYWKTVILKEEIVSMLSCLRAYYKKRKTNAGISISIRTRNENNRSIFLLNRNS